MEASAKNPDAKSPAAAGEEDLSMEEILQSIRKIIAEDGDEAKPAAAAPAPNGVDEVVPGSDVLELTEVVKEDGSVVNINETAAPAPAATSAPEPTGDVLSQIDAALGAPPQATPKPTSPAIPADSLLSDQAANTAMDSFRKLEAAAEPVLPPLNVTPSPAFRSGITVEDMVAAMLKPMMKEWLDANLPAIVERIVELEVRKISKV